MSSSRRIGFLQIILSGIFFGFLGFYGKTAYSYHILPGELLGLRFLIAGILLGLALSFFKPKALRLGVRNVIVSLLLGIFGYALFSSLYFMTLQGVSASLTVLLLYTYPMMVTLGSWLFGSEKLNQRKILVLLLSSFGILGLVWGEWRVEHLQYILYGIGAAFFYAIYILISQRFLQRVDSIGSSSYVQLGAGVILCALFFRNAERPLQLLHEHTLFIFSMAVICSLIPLSLFLAGLKKITPTEASLLSTTEPLFGVLISMWLLNEHLAWTQVGGGICILVGLVLTARS